MQINEKIKIVIITGAGILTPSAFIFATDPLYTIPTWSTVTTNYGDWFTGIFNLMLPAVEFGAILMLVVGVIGFVVGMLMKAVASMHG